MEMLKFDKKENIAVITISREKALNALNTQVLKELELMLCDIDKDKDIYCTIITGEGKRSFVAGADISEMKDLGSKEASEFGIFGNRVFRKLELLKMPVIAAINGYALGGGLELALSCDIRIASENAILGLPETGLGIIPGYGGTQRLPRTVGIAAAKRMIFTGCKLKADEALRIGLIDEVVPIDELMQKAMEIALTIANSAPIAVTHAKSAIAKGIDLDIDSALRVETELFAQCFDTEDQKNAMEAFVNKKKLDKFNNR